LLSLQERLSGAQAPILLGLSLLIVFLCLAALYESWSIPTSVLLVVPLGVLGAVLAVTLRGMPNDVFFKVGLITIIGLSAKNAILIIEFAKSLYDEGHDLIDATVQAARLRLRPIVMTSLAFILGVVPLAIATGASSASSASQQAIGTGVIGGMITATLAVVFVPVFFVVVRRLVRKRHKDIYQTTPITCGSELAREEVITFNIHVDSYIAIASKLAPTLVLISFSFVVITDCAGLRCLQSPDASSNHAPPRPHPPAPVRRCPAGLGRRHSGSGRFDNQQNSHWLERRSLDLPDSDALAHRSFESP
jgi:TRAP-type C4-dicarboxylate transport system permease small subunit